MRTKVWNAKSALAEPYLVSEITSDKPVKLVEANLVGNGWQYVADANDGGRVYAHPDTLVMLEVL